jgi:hypothetical protein
MIGFSLLLALSLSLSLFRRAILHPASQQVDLVLAKLRSILRHGIKPALMLNGTQKSVILADRSGSSIGAQIIIIGLCSGIVTSGFGTGGVKNCFDVTVVGRGQSCTVNGIRGILFLAGNQ